MSESEDTLAQSLLCATRCFEVRQHMSNISFDTLEDKEKAQEVYDLIVHHFNLHVHERQHHNCVDAVMCMLDIRVTYSHIFGSPLQVKDIAALFEYVGAEHLNSNVVRLYASVSPLNKDENFQKKITELYASSVEKACVIDTDASAHAKLIVLRRALCMKYLSSDSRRRLVHLSVLQLDELKEDDYSNL